MGKLIQSVVAVVLVVSLTAVSASPARLDRLRPSRSKFLARQEAAEDAPAPTPYPPSGIKPAIPFNLPTEEKEEKLIAPVNYYLPPLPAPANFNQVPAEVYGPPAKTYGPPEVDVKDEVEAVGSDQPEPAEEKPEEEQPEEEKPEEEQPVEEQPEEEQPEEEQPEEEKPEEENPEEEKPEEEQPEEPKPEEAQPEEPAAEEEVPAADDEEVEPEEASPEPEEAPNADSDDSDSGEPVPEEDIVELEPVAVPESVPNALPERLVLTRVSSRKPAKLRSAKLQVSPVVPLRRQALTAQPLFLIGGSLYSYSGQVFRV